MRIRESQSHRIWARSARGGSSPDCPDETPDVDGVWYNDGVPYCFASQTNATGRVFGNDAVVSVAAGATLDRSDINMEIGGLAVD